MQTPHKIDQAQTHNPPSTSDQSEIEVAKPTHWKAPGRMQTSKLLIVSQQHFSTELLHRSSLMRELSPVGREHWQHCCADNTHDFKLHFFNLMKKSWGWLSSCHSSLSVWTHHLGNPGLVELNECCDQKVIILVAAHLDTSVEKHADVD